MPWALICCFICLSRLLNFNKKWIRRLRGFPDISLFSKLGDQKYWFYTLFLVLMGHTYWITSWYLRSWNLSLAESNHDPFSSRWDRIRMYLSPSRIYIIKLRSITHVSIYCIFASWLLRINHESHITMYVPLCGILSDLLDGISDGGGERDTDSAWYGTRQPL